MGKKVEQRPRGSRSYTKGEFSFKFTDTGTQEFSSTFLSDLVNN